MEKTFDGMNIGEVTGAGTGEEAQKERIQGVSHRGQQRPLTPEEKAEREAAGRTQGRKGCKADRINMAFTTENYRFIRVMAKIAGMTMTGFTNRIVQEYRTEHAEVYEQANRLLAELERREEEKT